MSWGETLFLKKTIDGKKSLVASNNLYANLLSDVINVSSGEEKTTNLIKMKWSGSCKIHIQSYKSADKVATIGISKNGEKIATNNISQGYDVNEYNITFKMGDIIGIYTKGVSTRFWIDIVDIYADIIDHSAFNFVN